MSNSDKEKNTKATHNLLVVAKLEVILHDMIFVFLDFISIKKSSLHFREVPRDNELSSGGNDGILLLTLALVESAHQNQNLERI